MKFILTNNPLVFERLKSTTSIDFQDVSLHNILLAARDYIHKGHKLLSHPLSGSIKPNETLYKSIWLTQRTEELDMQSLNIIEGAVLLAKNFDERDITILEQYKEHMQMLDLGLIQ